MKCPKCGEADLLLEIRIGLCGSTCYLVCSETDCDFEEWIEERPKGVLWPLHKGKGE